MKRNYYKKGFTLLELMIYMGILSGFLFITFNFALDIMYGDIKSETIREVQQNSRFSMEKMLKVIKSASSVNRPVAGKSTNSLILEVADPNLDPTTFYTLQGKLLMTQGDFGPYELISDRVVVTEIQFTNRSESDNPGVITVDLEIEHENPSGRNEYNFSLASRSTISLFLGGITAVVEGFCVGTPVACDGLLDQTSCQSQSECLWGGGGCGGICTPCETFKRKDCLSQAGCSIEKSSCVGVCTSCDIYAGEGSCDSQIGCIWSGDVCSGSATDCDTHISELTCSAQSGCGWVPS